MDILVIVGLCLIIPSAILSLGFIIYSIVEMFKESLMSGLTITVLFMLFMGMMCLIFSIN